MLHLPDRWTWDFWTADDGERFHLFHLTASRALGDPDRRHRHAVVGHAVSADLTHWTRVEDALITSDRPAFDDASTWTGSVVRDADGTWLMFYTGTSHAEDGLVQRIGLATSTDLRTWTKAPDPPVAADPRWYERLPSGTWPDEAWRDPWVFPDPDGAGWHMLVTARAATGPVDDRGVIGHATSPDLRRWTVRPPLSAPGAGFGQAEVPQVAVVDGRTVLLFSCLPPELSDAHRATGVRSGVWYLPVDDLTGPYDLRGARPLTDDTLYAGRLVQDRDGRWVLLAFRNVEDGRFVGELADPIPVSWEQDRLVLADPALSRPQAVREPIGS